MFPHQTTGQDDESTMYFNAMTHSHTEYVKLSHFCLFTVGVWQLQHKWTNQIQRHRPTSHKHEVQLYMHTSWLCRRC